MRLIAPTSGKPACGLLFNHSCEPVLSTYPRNAHLFEDAVRATPAFLATYLSAQLCASPAAPPSWQQRFTSDFQKSPFRVCLLLAESFVGTDSEVPSAAGRNDNTERSTSLMGGHSQPDTSLLTLVSHPLERITRKVQACERICLRGVGGQSHTGTPRHGCEKLSSTPKPVISASCSFTARKAGRRGLPPKNNLGRAVFILGRKLLSVMKNLFLNFFFYFFLL